MKKIITILILALLIPVISAQDEEQQAGITPDSIFYKFDVFFDNVRATFTPTSLGRANVRLNIARERMAEVEAMASKDKIIEMKKAEEEGQKQMEKVGVLVKKVKPKDSQKLNASLQLHAEELEDCRQRLMVIKQRILKDDSFNVSSDELDESIANALEMIETSENAIDHVGEAITDTFNKFMSVELTAEILPDIRNMTPEERETWQEATKEKQRETEERQNELFNFSCNGGHGISTGMNIITREKRTTEWCCRDSDDDYKFNDRHYYVKGTLQYKVMKIKGGTGEGTVQEYEIHTDSCDGNTLTEWKCWGKERWNSEAYEWSDGCEDGACIKDEVELPEGMILIEDLPDEERERVYEAITRREQNESITIRYASNGSVITTEVS